MGINDSEVINNKDKTKILELVFDDGDDVLKCIKETMQENRIGKLETMEMKGSIKNATINYFIQNNLRTLNLSSPLEVVRAKGELLYDSAHNSMFGRIRVFYKENEKYYEGILVKADACQDLKLTFKYTI